MDKETYEILDTYMQACMAADTAHDKNHIYRVLYAALTIAEHEALVDYDCLITACLLHDIGRKEQFENPHVCHAKAGAKKPELFCVNMIFLNLLYLMSVIVSEHTVFVPDRFQNPSKQKF